MGRAWIALACCAALVAPAIAAPAGGWGAAPGPAGVPETPLRLAREVAIPPAQAAARVARRPLVPVASMLDPGLRLQAEAQLRLAQGSQGVRAAPVLGATPAPALLTFAQAYEMALANDATLRAARAEAAARGERLPQARAQLRPNVSGQFSRSRNWLESTQPDATGAAATADQTYTSSSRTLLLRQPLYNAQRRADVQQAEAQVAEAGANLERELQSMAIRLSTAYMQALSARVQLSQVLTQKRTYEGQVEAARRRFAGGAGVRTDIDEAQARLDMSFARELEARQMLEYTARQLQNLVNAPVGDVALLDEARLPLVPPQPQSLETWTLRAEAASPEIRSLQAQVEAMRHEVAKARAGHLPTLDAIAQWSVSDSDNVTRVNSRYDQKLLGVQLNVPIYAGGMVESQVRQALAQQQQAQEALEAVRRDLGLRIHKEYRDVSEGVLRVRALEQAVRSATTAVDSTRKSAQAGARSLVDILNAEEQLATARRELADARHLYVLARIRLRVLAGDVDRAIVDEAGGWFRVQ